VIKKIIIFLALILTAYGADPRSAKVAVQTKGVEHVIWDGNAISTIHGNHGDFASYHVTGKSGLEWPKGSGIGAVYQAGLWILAGKVNGIEEIRTAASEYVSEFAPGTINGAGESGKIYRIHRSEIEAFLNNDWNTFTSLSLMLPVTIIEERNAYTELVETPLPTDDFLNWPVEDGAPWVDANNDGVYNPPDGDYPDIEGDMFHWYVMNDGNESQHLNLWGTPPLNVEVRTALYGFDVEGPLKNTLFIKWQIENKGPDFLDSVFIAVWSDTDLGDATDDLTGCDPEIKLGFCYNDFGGDQLYGPAPPAYGSLFLQTPIVPSPGDSAFVSGEWIADYRNLPMKAFTPNYHSPWSEIEYSKLVFNLVNGLTADGAPIIDPTTGEVTTFVYNGDPVTGQGWVEYDYRPFTDRRILMSVGPFSLAPGDVQEMVVALIMSQELSNLASVASLRSDAGMIRSIWESNFQLPSLLPQITRISPHEMDIESKGPFYMVFRITDANTGLPEENLFCQLHYNVNTVKDSMVLDQIEYEEEPAYAVWVPEFPEVAGTTELRYYLSLTANDGNKLFWPSGAPYNYRTLIFGPDTTAPKLSGVSVTQDIHYLLPFEKTVIIDTVRDSRFGITDVELHWQIGDAPQQAASMTIYDSLFFDWEWSYRWSGVISGQAQAMGDTIYYWVTAIDSSKSGNTGISEKQWFVTGDREAVGDWEHTDSYDQTENWRMFTNGKFQNFNYPQAPWNRVLISHLTESGGIGDTMQYLRALDLTAFDKVWLTIPMAFNFHADDNFGVLEYSFNGSDWVVVDSFSGYQSPDTFHFPLSSYTDRDSMFLRFRVNRNSKFTEWIFDDIILHTDSTLLGIEKKIPLPRMVLLHQNYPNPFNPATTIRYELPEATHVRLVVYDLLGREVAVLVDKKQEPGIKEVVWDASRSASGIYFYRLATDQVQFTRKLVVLK